MTLPLADQKAQFRKQCRRLRQSLPEDQRASASRAICARIADWEIFENAQTILTYMPVKAEVDLRLLLQSHPHKIWVLPRIQPGPQPALAFHQYHPDHLVRHPFGMDEPAASQPEIPPSLIQLALVPGLAYDRRGWRLGYGGGYYDRFLAAFNGVSLGVTFASLLLESLPHGGHDIAMRWLVSEQALIRIEET